MDKIDMYKIFGGKGLIDDVNNFIDKITVFSKKKDIVIQVFDADYIFGKNHIITSINHALRAIDRKKNTTNSVAMEILLYASGERQLKLAIPKMGIKYNTNKIAFILLNKINSDIKILNNLIDELLEFLSLTRCDDVLNGNEKTLKKFGIDKNEIITITKNNYEKLVIEKVALVDIFK
jgi:KEOPS complex subunit Cgi121